MHKAYNLNNLRIQKALILLWFSIFPQITQVYAEIVLRSFATNARMHCIRALVAINLFLIILYFQKNLRFLNLSVYKSSVVQIIYLNIIVLASSISS